MFYQPMIRPEEGFIARIITTLNYPEHWHSELELLYVNEGETDVIINTNTRYTLYKGDVIVIPGNVIHGTVSRYPGNNDPARNALSIKIGYSFLGNSFNIFDNRHFPTPVFSVENRKCPLSKPIRSLWKLLEPDSINRNNIDVINKNILKWNLRSELFRLSSALLNVSTELSFDQKDHRKQMSKIIPVIDFVNASYYNPISLDDVAAVSGYDKTYFCKLFKKMIGVSFHDYLNCYRINVVCNYICDTNLHLNKIAQLTGFGTSKQLCKIFKLYTGMAPSEYRKLDPDQRPDPVPLRIYDDHDTLEKYHSYINNT